MQLNPAEISELIKSRIEGLAASSDIRNQGTVVSVSDGIVRVHGLSDVMAGEMLEFPATKDGQPSYGLALNLERDSVGAVILGEYEHISEGDTVKCTGRILEVPVGPELIGRVVNALVPSSLSASPSPWRPNLCTREQSSDSSGRFSWSIRSAPLLVRQMPSLTPRNTFSICSSSSVRSVMISTRESPSS
jgi:hypothetical protein